MLRKIRIGISLTIFLLLTFYLVDFAGILPNSFHVLAHIQLIPALLGLNLGILLFLLLLTWLTGRSYCSAICPLGIFQDIVIWISRKRDKKKHYDYRRALNRWRWGILLLIVVAGFSGFMFLLYGYYRDKCVGFNNCLCDVIGCRLFGVSLWKDIL